MAAWFVAMRVPKIWAMSGFASDGPATGVSASRYVLLAKNTGRSVRRPGRWPSLQSPCRKSYCGRRGGHSRQHSHDLRMLQSQLDRLVQRKKPIGRLRILRRHRDRRRAGIRQKLQDFLRPMPPNLLLLIHTQLSTHRRTASGQQQQHSEAQVWDGQSHVGSVDQFVVLCPF